MCSLLCVKEFRTRTVALRSPGCDLRCRADVHNALHASLHAHLIWGWQSVCYFIGFVYLKGPNSFLTKDEEITFYLCFNWTRIKQFSDKANNLNVFLSITSQRTNIFKASEGSTSQGSELGN